MTYLSGYLSAGFMQPGPDDDDDAGGGDCNKDNDGDDVDSHDKVYYY